jgi:FAD:protein FMN transferase
MSSTDEITRLEEPVFETFSIWSTSVVLGVTNPDVLTDARAILDAVLADVEQAASRFRPGTEIESLNAAAGTGPISVSPMMVDLVSHALWAAEMTGGACDPTIADSLVALGYDRDIDELGVDGEQKEVHRAPGIAGIELDLESRTLSLPQGTHLDLGATAKARAADLAAERIAEQFGVGALVDIGGDLRVAGATPQGGWRIGVTSSARDASSPIDEVVCIDQGGMASSSSVVRTWSAGGERHHHIIDPATGRSAESPFSLVTVAAPTCVEANAYSTAAMVWGDDALFELPQRSLVARIVRLDGTVERLGGWPEPQETA